MTKYITRREILGEACERMIREMYMRAQPSVDINIYIDKFKSGELDPDKDHVYDWHYLPMEILLMPMEQMIGLRGHVNFSLNFSKKVEDVLYMRTSSKLARRFVHQKKQKH